MKHPLLRAPAFLGVSRTARVAAVVLAVALASTGWASAQDVKIQGRTFYKDGQAWIPKGIEVNAFNRPILPILPDWANTASKQARALYTDKELDVIKTTFGADTVDVTVSQPGLDPESPIYSDQYLHDLVGAIAKARSKRFVVVATMDAQAQDDPLATLPCMPNDSTVRAWKTLAPQLMNDQGVMFEAFDEPCMGLANDGAKKWAEATQPVIDAIRALGAKNILFVAGLHYSRTTTGLFPLVRDTMPNRLALSIHPYVSRGWFVTPAQWESNFGKDAERYPMLATEWNATSVNDCTGYDLPTVAAAMIKYIQSKGIGLIGWAIDSDYGKLVQDHVDFVPTNYAHFKTCTPAPTPTDSSAGELIARFPHNP